MQIFIITVFSRKRSRFIIKFIIINSTTEYTDSNTRSPTHCHKIFCVLKLVVSNHKTYRFTDDVVVYNIYIYRLFKINISAF